MFGRTAGRLGAKQAIDDPRFNLIVQPRSRAVQINITNLSGIETGLPQRHTDGPLGALTGGMRC
ncbi:hypothetical protein D3C73_999040 [compost metagenome]